MSFCFSTWYYQHFIYNTNSCLDKIPNDCHIKLVNAKLHVYIIISYCVVNSLWHKGLP